MKTVFFKFNLFSLLIILAVFITMGACRENAKAKLLLNKWKVLEVQFEMNLPDESKAVFLPIIEQLKRTSYFKFASDHSFEFFTMGITTSGTWELSDDGKELFTIDVKTNREEKIIIEKLTSDTLIFSRKNQGQAVKMILTATK